MQANVSTMVSQAVALFDQQKYQKAFEKFLDAYQQCQNLTDQEEIFRILEEAYYLPNVTELQKTYESNVALLKEYPYFGNKFFHDFDDLCFRLFPISDELYYCYNLKERQFFGIYDAKTRHQMRYFFENLDQPLRIEDEDNFYNLKFLNDNVRRSEDFAGDNHIYLLYTSMEPLERLMLACDLGPILKQKKFVFLVGKDRDLYPLDFNSHFGIDYCAMKPQKLRIEEMNRICFWYMRSQSGALFGLDVLNRNQYIVMQFGAELYFKTYVCGHPLYQTTLLKDIFENISKAYSLRSIESVYHHPNFRWGGGLPDLSEFIQWLKSLGRETFTIPQLFRAYFIHKYYHDKPNANPRIAPTILWEPHMEELEFHNPLIFDFTYRMVLNSFRDPVTTAGRAYQRDGSNYIIREMWIGCSMHPELQEHYYAYRFEDLKTHPVETCEALCEVFNVPYDPDMLKADVEMQGINGEASVRGFDTSPLQRNIDSVFSRFDQIRLQIFYDVLLRHYGYPAFDFEECPMDDNDVAFLMKFPFKFEKDIVNKMLKQENVTQKELQKGLRQYLFQNMMAVWQLGKQGKLVLPKVIFPKVKGIYESNK